MNKIVNEFVKFIENNYKKIYLLLSIIFFSYLLASLYFRFAGKDEIYYLNETYIISEVLKSRQWIGDYATGLHGFFFKLPLAILFIFTGKSILLATLYNYIFVVLTIILTYKIAKKVFNNEFYTLSLVMLFVFSFEFTRSAPTYLREFVSVFSILLFINEYLNKKNTLLLSFYMLLILDSKEYMFFIVGLGFILTQIILMVNILRDKFDVKIIINTISNGFLVFLPSLIYFILMLTTSYIPLNAFLTSILGLNTTGSEWNSRQFSTNLSTQNLLNTGDIKMIPKIIFQSSNQLLSEIIRIINVLLSYIEKVLVPRTFSYISIPKLVILPAIISSFYYFKSYAQKNDSKLLIINTIFVFFIIYILRASHGRYLFSVAPLIYIFFVLFIKDIDVILKNKSILFLILLWIFEIAGLYFEITYEIPKMIISLFIFIQLVLLLYLINLRSYAVKFSKLLFFISIFSITFLSSFAYSFSQGQFNDYIDYGRDFEINRIEKELDKYNRIYVNDTGFGILLPYALNDTSLKPNWRDDWQLKNWIPKSKTIKLYNQPKVTVIDYIPFDELLTNKESIFVLFVSKTKTEFENQKLLSLIQKDNRIVEIKNVDMIGKTMYVFKAK